jgi:2-C-methyl-D-erythritol 4-phosphate cytidylyltransferase
VTTGIPASKAPRGVGAIVVAAGRGERLGGDRPKALVEVAGRALVAWSVAGLRQAGVADVVVVHPPGEEQAFAEVLRGDDAGAGSLRLVPGGQDRSASVRAGLAALPATTEVVAVHDAARAFTPPAVSRAAIAAVTGDVLAAAPALPVADTLKRISGEQVVTTVERADLVAVQTPQVFPREVLVTVAAAAASATDDLALVERAITEGSLAGRIVWVPGSPRGLKVTFPDDLVLAEAFAERRSPSTHEVGSTGLRAGPPPAPS